MDKSYAPWTETQIQFLEYRQAKSYMHPYTCVCGENLIPKKTGWNCPKCQYVQIWAWADDVGPEDIVPPFCNTLGGST